MVLEGGYELEGSVSNFEAVKNGPKYLLCDFPYSDSN